MTTIVYCHKTKQVAIDSRISSSGGLIVSDTFKKFRVRNGVLFFMSCSIHNMEEIMDQWFRIGKKWKGEKFSCLVVIKKKVRVFYSCPDGETISFPAEFNEACGSGMEWALAAMDFGATASDAIKYAMTRDSNTGGKVHCYDVEKDRWDIVCE